MGMGLVGVSACGSATDSTIGGEMGGYGGYVDGGDFRSKVWSISGGPKYRRRNSAFSDVFLICVPVAMKFAHLENVEGRWGRRSDQSNLPVTWPIISIHCWCLCCSNDGRASVGFWLLLLLRIIHQACKI
ncbi:uncharacterized protein [Spinacia oleracea]|uniref:Uncharacterized protein isoform X2 n=1 Tax=Spinacia oleracea TaxID=3562 RepID=A0ABM3RWB2_SPIOL|nr:uncharacterized protein LOC110796529 isoform X2 [Spinacia oleracea]